MVLNQNYETRISIVCIFFCPGCLLMKGEVRTVKSYAHPIVPSWDSKTLRFLATKVLFTDSQGIVKHH